MTQKCNRLTGGTVGRRGMEITHLDHTTSRGRAQWGGGEP
jgi:hypothetical protein